MTVLVGVKCTDGIVIGADSMATSTAGFRPVVQIPSNSKINLFNNNIIVAATGAVGLSQRLCQHVNDAVKGGVFTGSRHDCITNLSRRVLMDFGNSFVQPNPQFGLGFGALVAAPIGGEPCLIEYGSTDFQPEVKEDRLFTFRWDQVSRLPILSSHSSAVCFGTT